MIYTANDLECHNIKSGTMIWACNFTLDKSKGAYALKQEPQYGMLTSDLTKDRIEKRSNQGITSCQFFIPMENTDYRGQKQSESNPEYTLIPKKSVQYYTTAAYPKKLQHSVP